MVFDKLGNRRQVCRSMQDNTSVFQQTENPQEIFQIAEIQKI